MNFSRYKYSQLKLLCSIIGCKPYEVIYITSHLNEYYHEWFEKKVHKETGELKTFKDGTVKQRAIRPSLNRLKVIQRSVKNKILATIPLPDNIYGGVKKKSNISNAKRHQGNKYKFTTDLQNFYPGIKYKQGNPPA
jgi:RNA-directed DNA polymerase